MAWGRKAPQLTYIEIDLNPDRLRLELGWTEVWEHGRRLGQYDRSNDLERYVMARPGRAFQIRFVQPPLGCVGGALFPVCSLTAAAGEKGVDYWDWEPNEKGS
jgi:hypothetical protein